MINELKPVHCGCGGKARTELSGEPFTPWIVKCPICGIRTELQDTEAEAIIVWNRAMVDQKKGKWMFAGEQKRLPLIGICSVCGHYESAVWIISHRPNFCPNCGTKME